MRYPSVRPSLPADRDRTIAVKTPSTATRTRPVPTRLSAAISDDSNIQVIVRVIVRVRPPAGPELTGYPGAKCVAQDGPRSLFLVNPDRAGAAEQFTFDHVAGESAVQEDLFELAGRPIVENCLAGYNSTMFAYGQTGSGKTYTMFGADVDKADVDRLRGDNTDVEVGSRVSLSFSLSQCHLPSLLLAPRLFLSSFSLPTFYSFPPPFPTSVTSLLSPPLCLPSSPHLCFFPPLSTSVSSLLSPPLFLPSSPHLCFFPPLPTSVSSLLSPPLFLPSSPHLCFFPPLSTSEKQQRAGERLTFICTCSFLEIYNEHFYDLLDPKRCNLHIREGPNGVYVENLTKQPVTCFAQVMELIQRVRSEEPAGGGDEHEPGEQPVSQRLHVQHREHGKCSAGAGRLAEENRECLPLAALRAQQKSSGATGERLKEASSINTSLSQLGKVIMVLVESLRENRPRHVPYRDSYLTFLLQVNTMASPGEYSSSLLFQVNTLAPPSTHHHLRVQDSLGGNSKTTIIACISPFAGSFRESHSTLKFAQRAKLVHNKAVVNEAAEGEKDALKKEIARLKVRCLVMHTVLKVRHKDELHRLYKLCTCEARLLLPASSSSPPFSLPHSRTTTPRTPRNPATNAAGTSTSAAACSPLAIALQERANSPRHVQLLGEIERLERTLAGCLRRERELEREVGVLRGENAKLRKQLAAASAAAATAARGGGGNQVDVMGANGGAGDAGGAEGEGMEGRLATVEEGEEEEEVEEEGSGSEGVQSDMENLKDQVAELLVQKAAAGGGHAQAHIEELTQELQGARAELGRCREHLRLSDAANEQLARQTKEMEAEMQLLAAQNLSLEEQISSLKALNADTSSSAFQRGLTTQKGGLTSAPTPVPSVARAAAPSTLIPTPLVTTTRGAHVTTPSSGGFGTALGAGINRNLEEAFSGAKGFETPLSTRGKGATAGRGGGGGGGGGGRVGGMECVVDCRSSLRHVGKDQDRFRQQRLDLDSAIKGKLEAEWANSALKANLKLQEQEARELVERMQTEEGRRHEAERLAEEAEREVREAAAAAAALAREKASVEEQLRAIQEQVRALQGREERSEEEKRDLEEALRRERDLGEEAAQLAEAEWKKTQEATARRIAAERSLQRTMDEAKNLRGLLDDSEETKAKYVRLKHELRAALQRLVKAAEQKVEDEKALERMREEMGAVRAQVLSAGERAEEAERRVREGGVVGAGGEVGEGGVGAGVGGDEVAGGEGDVVDAGSEVAGGEVRVSEGEEVEREQAQRLVDELMRKVEELEENGREAERRAEEDAVRLAEAVRKVQEAQEEAALAGERVRERLEEEESVRARLEVLEGLMQSEEAEAVRANAEVMLLQGILEDMEGIGRFGMVKMEGEGGLEQGQSREELEGELLQVREEVEGKEEEIRRHKEELERSRRELEEVTVKLGVWEDTWGAWETHRQEVQYPGGCWYDMGVRYNWGRVVLELVQRELRGVKEGKERAEEERREADEAVWKAEKEVRALVDENGVLRGRLGLEEGDVVPVPGKGRRESFELAIGALRARIWDGRVRERELEGEEARVERERRVVEERRREVEERRREVEEKRRRDEEAGEGGVLGEEGVLQEERDRDEISSEMEGIGVGSIEREEVLGTGEMGEMGELAEMPEVAEMGEKGEVTPAVQAEGEGQRAKEGRGQTEDERRMEEERLRASSAALEGQGAQMDAELAGFRAEREKQRREVEQMRAVREVLERERWLLDQRGESGVEEKVEKEKENGEEEKGKGEDEGERRSEEKGDGEGVGWEEGGEEHGMGVLSSPVRAADVGTDGVSAVSLQQPHATPVLFSASRELGRGRQGGRMSLPARLDGSVVCAAGGLESGREGAVGSGDEWWSGRMEREREREREMERKEGEVKQLVKQIEVLQKENRLLHAQLCASEQSMAPSISNPAMVASFPSTHALSSPPCRLASIRTIDFLPTCLPSSFPSLSLSFRPLLLIASSARITRSASFQRPCLCPFPHLVFVLPLPYLSPFELRPSLLLLPGSRDSPASHAARPPPSRERQVVLQQEMQQKGAAQQSEAVLQRSMADKSLQKNHALSQENAHLKQQVVDVQQQLEKVECAGEGDTRQQLEGVQQQLEKAEGELVGLVGQHNPKQRIHTFSKVKVENSTLRAQNEEMAAAVKRMELRVKRLEEEVGRHRKKAGQAERIDFDEEARLQQRLEEVERGSADVAQKLLTVCQAVLQITEGAADTENGGESSSSSGGSSSVGEGTLGADPSGAALAALNALKFRIKAADDEISDLKFQARMAAEKADLCELREKNSIGHTAQVLSPPLPPQFLPTLDSIPALADENAPATVEAP
ncbi:unnamed protein product [Closterium sp. NIES-65]|nr:unnamed protein product [Closterium sp. NIES-65]